MRADDLADRVTIEEQPVPQPAPEIEVDKPASDGPTGDPGVAEDAPQLEAGATEAEQPAPAPPGRGGPRPGAGRPTRVQQLVKVRMDPQPKLGDFMQLEADDRELIRQKDDLLNKVGKLRTRRRELEAERLQAMRQHGPDRLKLKPFVEAVAEITAQVEATELMLSDLGQLEAEQRAREAQADRLDHFHRQQALAARREAAAVEMDTAVALFARAYSELTHVSSELYLSMPANPNRDASYEAGSNAGAPKAIAAVRRALRDAGAEWAHPREISMYAPLRRTIAEAIREMNNVVVELQRRNVVAMKPVSQEAAHG